MAYADKEKLTSLAQGIRDRLLIKDKTEAQALVLSVTYPNCIYWTSDTHNIIVGGQVYGRSNQVSADAPFSYLPSDVSSPSADPQFDVNHDTIYIQPIKTGTDAGKIKLWWYVNGAWTSTDTLDLVLPTDASDITYDLTATPDLGSGDVQSAIEALDSKVEKVAEDVVRTGYLIASWEDDKILTNTTYAVGSTICEWGNGVRYGCRGVRLNVKEGDKVLLDTYSPALFGLIFTDENRVVKALYDDRRFDGVWTAPCDGYCYIQDVLYRDCYHYSSAHGHLAYMAHDARNKLKGKQDWFNQYSPTLRAKLPKTYTTTFTGNDGRAWQPQLDLYSPCSKIFQVFAFKARINIDMSDEPNARLNARMASSNYIALPSWYLRDTEVGEERWLPCLHNFGTNQINISNLIIWFGELLNGHTYSIDVLDVYHHDFDDYKQARMLYDGIWNGTIIPDGDLVGKDTDILRNAIGLQSISDLGYNILDYGATLPIDEEGYKYAKEIYERYKDNPPTGNNWNGTASPFNHDTKLVYLPQIDFSKFKTSGTDYLGSAFNGCTNLVCVGDITLPEESTGGYSNFFNSTFANCYSLKQVGNMQAPMNKNSGCHRTFLNCFALEKVGRFIVKGHASSSLFMNCYSLERIEEIVLRDLPYDTSTSAGLILNCVNLRYMLGKELGTRPEGGTYRFNTATVYGVPNDKHPDARQSLVDSLLTYSYDRVNDPDGLGTAGTTCTITLSANTYAQLTASEIEQINAKGYTLTHP